MIKYDTRQKSIKFFNCYHKSKKSQVLDYQNYVQKAQKKDLRLNLRTIINKYILKLAT